MRNSGENSAPDGLHARRRRVVCLREADRRPAHLLGPGVGGHDDDDVAEVGLAAVVVGQRAVVHHLQQQIENVRMRLLDLIEQQHRSADAW